MKKIFLLSALALLTVAGCNKESNNIPNPSESGELAVLPMNGGSASRITRGYVEESKFVGTTYESLHASKKATAPRTMQLSAYLTPQNGEAKNYFVDKTYSKDPSSETTWWNTNTVGGDHDPIYWPVGGTLDFLAYSVSSEKEGAGKSQNIKAVWESANSAQKVTLTVPGENTQNDILFASAYGVESKNGATPVNMTFNHAQAWLEFILTGSVDDVHPDGIVNVKKIELENVYNAGTLNITNNGGNAMAKWDFTCVDKQNIAVDNFNENLKLSGSPKYLDMLLPQQAKTEFVIYYTLGSDTQELAYRFTTDKKSWLMGEKYIYKINISTSEVTVEPIVTEWKPVEIYNYTVKTPATTVGDGETTFGTVKVDLLPSEESFKIQGAADDGSATYTCNTWGAQVTLTATPEEGYYFKEWSDGETANPRTFTITESVELPEAVFAEMVTITIAPTEFGKISINDQDVASLKVIPGSEVTLKATTGSTFKFVKWGEDGNTDATRTVTVTEDITYTPYFGVGVDYVEIGDLKWATQNLAITESGKKYWTKFKYDNDDEIFVIGDYFQWGAHENYAMPVTDLGEGKTDKGLLLYTKFTNEAIGDSTNEIFFKSPEEGGKQYHFAPEDDENHIGISPYYDKEISKYTAYLDSGEGKAGKSVLEPEDDLAYIISDGLYRMATSEEFDTLVESLSWLYDMTDGGWYGYKKDESNKAKYNAMVFFPFNGAIFNSEFKFLGRSGFSWSASVCTAAANIHGHRFRFTLGDILPQDFSNREDGYSVRPVLNNE